ncbi:hypothetical protein [Flavimaricola marinus]|uniref:Uncharacterized protein n=1 Tax=Flavimaricola marinus TaxID=1819565 RepID=A0A238LED9_9RHOB|nr:hypothetical protein [Flavimaricola marinus]SMY07784.1 hypothetical protein LOM8899_01924 [Flavimaricola marinus]
MKRFFALLAAVSAAGAVQAQDRPNRVIMADFLREAGCSTTMDGLLAFDRIAPSDVQAALNEMLSLGFVELTADGGFALSPALCGIPNAPGEEVLTAAIRLHGCVMTESVAEENLAVFGLNRTNTTGFVDALIARGHGALANGETFSLSSDICAGAALAPLPDAEPFDPGAVLVQVLVENGCQLTEAEAASILPGLGVSMDMAENAAEALIASGQASWAGDRLIGDPVFCATALGAPPEEIEALAQSRPASARDRFVQMMSDAGCSITEDEFEAVMARYALTENEAETVAEVLIGSGQAMMMGGVFILDRAVCDSVPASDPSPEATPLDRFVAAIRANDCAMTQEQASARMAEIGLTMQDMDDLADHLMDTGQASVVDRALVLSPELCAAAPVSPSQTAETAADAPVQAQVVAPSRVTLESFVAAVHSGGCRMTAETAASFTEETGATLLQLQEMAQTLINLGLAVGEGDDLVLSEMYCESYRP